jgi:ankyrin repeat protein
MTRESISEIRHFIMNHSNVFHKNARRATTIRQSRLWISEGRSWTRNTFGDVDSIFSFQTAVSDTEFDFDNEIISSLAYRRAFLQAMRDPKQRQSKIGTVASNELIDVGDLIDFNHEPEIIGEYSLALRELIPMPTSERLGSQQSPIPCGYKDRNILGQHCEPSTEQLRRPTSILENMDTSIQQGIANQGSSITPVTAGASRDSTWPLNPSFPKALRDPPLEVKRRSQEKFLNLDHALSLDVFSTLSSEEERSAIQLLRENQFDFRFKGFNKSKALCWAAYSGHETVVRLLLEKGADVAAKCKGGLTPLHCAAQNGHEAVVWLLLEKGADAEAEDENGWMALHFAVQNGHKEVELLVEKGGNIAAKEKGGGAAKYDQKLFNNSLSALVGEDEVGNRSLTQARASAAGPTTTPTKRLEIDMLKALGHRRSRSHSRERTIVQKAVERTNTPIGQLGRKPDLQLSERADSEDPEEGKYDEAEEMNQRRRNQFHFREKGPDVVTKNESGATPPLPETVVRLLVEMWADVAEKDKEGWTALHVRAALGHVVAALVHVAHVVAVNGHDPTVLQLLEKVAKAVTETGGMVLHTKAMCKHEAVVRLLVEMGADIVAKDKEGYTALRRAAGSRHEEVVRLLLENRTDVAAKDKEGWVALHVRAALRHVKAALELVAATLGLVAAAQQLLEEGADVTAEFKEGWTPLLAAVVNRHYSTVQQLLEKVADVVVKAKGGDKPLRAERTRGGSKATSREVADVAAKEKGGGTALHKAA